MEGKKIKGIMDKVSITGKSDVLVFMNCASVLLFTLYGAVLNLNIQQVSALLFSFTALGVLIVKGHKEEHRNWGRIYV